jgi:hypothetical protein
MDWPRLPAILETLKNPRLRLYFSRLDSPVHILKWLANQFFLW